MSTEVISSQNISAYHALLVLAKNKYIHMTPALLGYCFGIMLQ